MRLLCFSGNLSRPSRTRTLVEAIASHFSQDDGWRTDVYDLIDVGHGLGSSTSRENASPEHLRIWDAVRDCDALVVASPVYKASYGGLLKHFFDLLEMDILAGKPVLLAATGKAPQHALMIDHQFRPLFAFFRALSIPTSIFAVDADFASPNELTNGMKEKVRLAADELNRFSVTLRSALH